MDQDSQSQHWLKWILSAAGVGVIAPFLLLPTATAILIAVIIVALLALLVGGYLLWRYQKRRKARERFVGFVDEATKGAPSGVDAKGLAELDALRKKFQEGIRAYKSRGKDLYSLPWFLVVGEPSAGKSEAVRHCGVGFPPGLTDYLQGTGGTINMHWWFTNNAVVLDTAGKLMFSAVKPGESSLWQEFLRLLKKARPYCPINGLLLVLPVDSLIRDSANKIAEKATLIAKQLDLIQRILDVRFPVFVLVTKCDLLTGFRELFGGMEDIEATQQMLGWSNPDPLDAPFRSQLVDQHLEHVAERLRRRRIAMLRDPAETGPSHPRRTDAVDALFALPHSLLLIAPRLKRYLQTIFVAGEWAPKPVFLRGIYFTSSLQQGSPLDEALAALRGVSVEEMYEHADEERQEKTFFLYDLFTEKIFQEKGLVTRATNTLAMLRRRRWTVLGAGAAALLLWAGISSYGYFTLKESVGKESELWEAASRNWQGGAWNPIVESTNSAGGVWRYAGNDSVNGAQTSVRFHEDVYNRVSRGLPVPWIFWPIKFSIQTDAGQREAQLILFESSVVRPLLDAARTKMELTPLVTHSPEQAAKHGKALEALIQVERDLLEGSKQERIDHERTTNFLNGLVSYVTETSFSAPSNLIGLLIAYGESARGGDAWLPANLSGGATLKDNPAINRGLNQFLSNAVAQSQRLEQQFQLLTGILATVRAYRDLEMKLYHAARTNEGGIPALLGELWPARTNLDLAARAAKVGGLALAGQSPLQTNYQTLSKRSAGETESPLAPIRRVASWKGQGILSEIKTNLDAHAATFSQRFILNPTEAEIIAELDRNFLSEVGGGRKRYEIRAELYHEAAELAASVIGERPASTGDQLVKRFVEVHQRFEQCKTNQPGKVAAELDQTCQTMFRQTAARFLQRQRAELSNRLGFPILWDDHTRLLTYDNLKQLKDLVTETTNLVSQQALQPYLLTHKQSLEALESDVRTVAEVANALGSIKTAKIAVNYREHRVAVELDKKRELPGSKLLGQLRWVRVRVEDHGQDFRDIGRPRPGEKEIVLADNVTLDKPIEIDVRDRQEGPSVIASTFRQGLFHWLWQSKDAKLEADGRTFKVPLKVRDDPLPPAFIWFEVEMVSDPSAPPLPTLADWPKTSKFSNSSRK